MIYESIDSVPFGCCVFFQQLRIIESVSHVLLDQIQYVPRLVIAVHFLAQMVVNQSSGNILIVRSLFADQISCSLDQRFL